MPQNTGAMPSVAPSAPNTSGSAVLLVLSTIAQRWRLRVVPEHPVVPQPVITLRTKHGIKMTPVQRPERAISRG